MDLTIKQLANRLKISRPTVEVRMNHIPSFRDKYTRKRGNKIMISDLGCKLIAKTKAAPRHRKRGQMTSHRDKKLVLKVLHHQTLEQDSMIKSQDQTIKKLTKLLDQQQQLQLSTETENKRLKHRVKKLTHVSAKSTQDNVLAFNGKNLSSIGKVTKPQKKSTKSKAANKATNKAKRKTQAKKRKKARHRSFWRRFFGK